MAVTVCVSMSTLLPSYRAGPGSWAQRGTLSRLNRAGPGGFFPPALRGTRGTRIAPSQVVKYHQMEPSGRLFAGRETPGDPAYTAVETRLRGSPPERLPASLLCLLRWSWDALSLPVR